MSRLYVYNSDNYLECIDNIEDIVAVEQKRNILDGKGGVIRAGPRVPMVVCKCAKQNYELAVALKDLDAAEEVAFDIASRINVANDTYTDIKVPVQYGDLVWRQGRGWYIWGVDGKWHAVFVRNVNADSNDSVHTFAHSSEMAPADYEYYQARRDAPKFNKVISI